MHRYALSRCFRSDYEIYLSIQIMLPKLKTKSYNAFYLTNNKNVYWNKH